MTVSVDYFLQQGAGAVPRTYQDKMRDIVALQDFGAKGDGTTDDTAAVAAATAVGLPVYAPLTNAFYVVTSLTSDQLNLLYGPGVIKIGGAITPIASAPSFATGDLAGLNVVKPTMAPNQANGVQGSVGNGGALLDITRTGGWGTYGSLLNKLHVSAAVPAGQIDVGVTSWVTHTNFTGGQSFGTWVGANTPSANLGQTYSSGAAIGMEINVGNRWGNFGVQTDVGGARYTVGLQVVPDVLPAKDGINWISVRNMTIGSPCVITITGHGFVPNMGIVFGGTGTLPTGITAGTRYYVSASGLTADTFQISSAIGGPVINTTGAFTGTITALPSWAGSFAMVTGSSVWGHNWWVGHLTRYDTILGGGYNRLDNGGSVPTNAPAAWAKLGGYYTKGLDMSNVGFNGHALDFGYATFTSGGAPINFDYAASYAGTATAGSVASPGNFQGFIKLAMNGTTIKIPFYNN